MNYYSIIVYNGIIMDSQLLRYFNTHDYQYAGQVDSYKWMQRK